MDPQPIHLNKWTEQRTEIIGANIGLNSITCERSFTVKIYIYTYNHLGCIQNMCCKKVSNTNTNQVCKSWCLDFTSVWFVRAI